MIESLQLYMKNEPVRFSEGVRATVTLIALVGPAVFGRTITPEALALTTTVLGFWLMVLVRARVTPTPSGTGPGSGSSSTPTTLLVLLVAGAALWLSGCAARQVQPPTPKAQAAWTATQVSIRVNELADVVMELQRQKELPTARARTIVQFCIDANFILAEAPNGWQAQVVAAWDQARQRLPDDYPAGASSKLQLLWIGVSSIMEAFRALPPAVKDPVLPLEACLAY